MRTDQNGEVASSVQTRVATGSSVERGWTFRLEASSSSTSAVEICSGGELASRQLAFGDSAAASDKRQKKPAATTSEPSETVSLLSNDTEDDGDDDAIIDETKRNVRTASTAASDTPTPSPSWTYSAPGITPWSLSSDILLSVTYRPAVQAVPEYTNIGIVSDWMCRALGYCTRSGPTPAARKKSTNPATSCAPLPVGRQRIEIRREVYAHQDVERVEVLQDGIEIRGWEGKCRAVQVFLRPRNHHRFPETNSSVAVQKSWKEQVRRASISTQTVPRVEGEDWFSKSELGVVADNGLPIPPWVEDNSDTYGPIVTFAIPQTETSSANDNVQTPSRTKSSTNLVKDCPPLLWKVQFPPDPTIAIEAFTVFDGELHCTPSCVESMLEMSDPTNVYINGYQSWSFAGSVVKGQPQPVSAMPDFLSRAFNRGGTIPPKPSSLRTTKLAVDDSHDNLKKRISKNSSVRGGTDKDYADLAFYTSDFYTCITSNAISDTRDGLDESGGPGLVMGWLSQHAQFGLVTIDSELKQIVMHSSLGEGVMACRSLTTDWAYGQVIPKHCYDEEPMVHFLHAVAAYNKAMPMQMGPPLTGWCSWYHYYENIDALTLTGNFKRLAGLKNKISSNVAIVDDGYMTAWGDWTSLKKKQFAGTGMKAVADEIRQCGMKPGIWLAPFACDKKSLLAKEHPDWIIRNDEGRPANSSNCGKFFYGLDATNPAVRQHAFTCVRRAVQEWGYDVLKLDFLYAACLAGNGKFDLCMSRAEAMHLALQTLRAAAGSATFVIGCGCPLGTAVGYMDGMRVSADTGPTWYPSFPLPWKDNSTLPCLRAMIRNSTTRASLGHRWWHNDPDCVLLGETTDLTDAEVVSAATIVAMTGGMMLLSDDLTMLSPARLRVATRIYPVTGVSGVALDLHTTTDMGLPSLLRLWCTDSPLDKPGFLQEPNDAQNETKMTQDDILFGVNLAASENARRAAFSPDRSWPMPQDRVRNCLPVASGLGTWSVVSMSNWLDVAAVVRMPVLAILPPSFSSSDENQPEDALSSLSNDAFSGASDFDNNGTSKEQGGFHIFAFWSSKYIWVPQQRFYEERTLSKKLDPRESEIFHVKAVTTDRPQYVGSDLHFTCGYEVREVITTPNCIDLQLKTSWKRSGYVFLYVPGCENEIVAKVHGVEADRGVEIIAKTPYLQNDLATYVGRVVRVWIVIYGDGSECDGKVTLTF